MVVLSNSPVVGSGVGSVGVVVTPATTGIIARSIVAINMLIIFFFIVFINPITYVNIIGLRYI